MFWEQFWPQFSATLIGILLAGIITFCTIKWQIKKEKIPVKTTYKEGQEVDVIVSSVDKKRHRVEAVPVLKEKPIGYR